MNTTIQVKMGILSDTITPVVVWEELHASVKTNPYGVFNLVIGKGTRQEGSALTFNDIDWAKAPLFLKVQVYYQGAWKYMGSSRLWSVPYAMVSNDIGAPLKKLAVTGETDNLEEALFEVKNKDGQIIFAVYNEGVRVYVSDGDEKGVKGGFAIGGFGTTKAPSHPFFVVRPDSIRMYLYDTVKAVKGGFAIGGYGTTKAGSQDYLFVSSDSIRAYIDNSSAKGPKGGFAIGGFGTVKDRSGHYFDVSTDTSRIINPSQNRILWYPLKNAFLAGRVLIEKPDSVGINSFATGYESKSIGQFSQAMGFKSVARGDFATAIGKRAVANKVNSFAFGDNAKALNSDSYAFGAFSEASGLGSFAFGYAGRDSTGPTGRNTVASGNFAFALGLGSQATGESAFAFGADNKATNYFSMAMGLSTTSSGWASTTLGFKTQATAGVSMAAGLETVASGPHSFAGGDHSEALSFSAFSYGYYNSAGGANSAALGQRTKATGENSFATGQFTEANGKNSVAIGTQTLTEYEGSFAGGGRSKAVNVSSFAYGYMTTASGPHSAAFGLRTMAAVNQAFATGDSTKAAGLNSFTSGLGTISNSFAAVVLGRFNDTILMTNPGWYIPTDPAFVIGNGTSNTNRKNAFIVLQNGNTGIAMINPQHKLDIAGGNGRVESGYNWLTNSDIRYKKNIENIENPLGIVLAMHGVKYDMINDKSGSEGERKNIGFIAQELETVVPEVVVTGSDGYKSVAYDKLTAVLTEAIKEQQELIESQQSQIDELKSLVDKLISEK